jgi:hypothetical protein
VQVVVLLLHTRPTTTNTLVVRDLLGGRHFYHCILDFGISSLSHSEPDRLSNTTICDLWGKDLAQLELRWMKELQCACLGSLGWCDVRLWRRSRNRRWHGE